MAESLSLRGELVGHRGKHLSNLDGIETCSPQLNEISAILKKHFSNSLHFINSLQAGLPALLPLSTPAPMSSSLLLGRSKNNISEIINFPDRGNFSKLFIF